MRVISPVDPDDLAGAGDDRVVPVDPGGASSGRDASTADASAAAHSTRQHTRSTTPAGTDSGSVTAAIFARTQR